MNNIKNYLKLQRCRWHWKRAGVVFVHVPKAAGTSFSVPLYGRFLGHYTACEIQMFDSELLQKLPSFGVVRNPWDRCVSAFRFAKRPELKDDKTPSINLAVRAELEPYEDFDDFVIEWLAKQEVNQCDYVFQEQSRFLCDSQNNILVNHICKLEDVSALQQWLRQKFDPQFSIPNLNQTGERVDFKKWYTSKTRDIVSEVYRRDIQNFGYEFG